MIENPRIKTLDQELKVLKSAVDRMYQLTSVERLNYSMIESQFENLKTRNAKVAEETKIAEEKIAESLRASDVLVENAQKKVEEMRTQVMVMYSKANTHYKEIENILSKAEKQSVKDHLKQLEAVAA